MERYMPNDQFRPEHALEVWLTRHHGRLGRYRVLGAATASELIAELEGAVEELSVSQEELRAQSDELRSAASQIESERARYMVLFDAAPDAYLITDVHGVIRQANSAAAKLLGVAQARLAGKPLPIFVTESERGAFRGSITRLARFEQLAERDVRIVARDGVVRTAAAKAVAVPGESSGDTEIRWILRDVSDRIRAEEALHMLRYEQAARQLAQKSERRALFLADASHSLLEVEGVEATIERIVTLAVPALGSYALLDVVDAQGALRRVAAEHVDDGQRTMLRAAAGSPEPITDSTLVRHVLEEGRPEMAEHAPGDGGSAGYPAALEMILPLRGHRRMLGALTIGRDAPGIEEVNPLALGEAFAGRAAAALEHALQYDEVLAARREAEQANAEKARFLSVLSHEIRTPLSAALGYVELMLGGIPEPLPERHLTYAKGIHASIQHQLGLVEQILQFARIDSERGKPNLADVDVAQLVLAVAEIVRPAAASAGLELAIVGAERPRSITTDGGKLRQALLNIAGNAIRFTESGTVRIGVAHGDGHVVLSVQDTGPGIAPDDLEHVFETFWRGASSHHRWPGGMGLGLAITRELIEELGGEIGVRSELGKGTEFTIRLSAGAAPAATTGAFGSGPPD
jgi:PAS domain S-box-containing protein